MPNKEKISAVFLDRDGCLNEDPGYVHKIEQFKLLPGVIEGLKKLSKYYEFFIITNQSGISRGIFTENDLIKFNNKLIEELKKEKIEIKKIYCCVHKPEDNCDCRKPSTKYMLEAAKEFGMSLKDSWVIGDHPHDIIMGINAGSKTVYLLTGHGKRHFGQIVKSKLMLDFIAQNFQQAADYILNKK